jgi:hypothetical protein
MRSMPNQQWILSVGEPCLFGFDQRNSRSQCRMPDAGAILPVKSLPFATGCGWPTERLRVAIPSLQTPGDHRDEGAEGLLASNAARTGAPTQLLHCPSDRATLASDVRGQSGPETNGPFGSRFERVITWRPEEQRRVQLPFALTIPSFKTPVQSLGSLSDRLVLFSYLINQALA